MRNKGSMTMLMESRAKDPVMDVRSAADLLRVCPDFRTLKDILLRFAPQLTEDQLRTKLIEELCADHPDRQRDSVARNVRNWMTSAGRTRVDRLTLMELAFILDLTVEQMDELLALVTDAGIHWRSPMDIVYGCARDWGKSYAQATALYESLPEGIRSCTAGDPAQKQTKTRVIYDGLGTVYDEESLRAYLTENAGALGELHNTAIEWFTACMTRLEGASIEDGLALDAGYDVRDILETYLYRALVPKRAEQRRLEQERAMDKQQKAIMKQICSEWPDESEISRIRNGKVDVDRKLLVLLFLATDGCSVESEEDIYQEFYPEESDPQDLFEDVRTRIDALLIECGFCALDARSPFDWLVLFALAGRNLPEEEYPEERIEEVLRLLFSKEAGE